MNTRHVLVSFLIALMASASAMAHRRFWVVQLFEVL